MGAMTRMASRSAGSRDHGTEKHESLMFTWALGFPGLARCWRESSGHGPNCEVRLPGRC